MKRIVLLILTSFLFVTFAFSQTKIAKCVIRFELHRQYRPYELSFITESDTVTVNWKLYRNFVWQNGSYKVLPSAFKSGHSLSWLQPLNGKHYILSDSETFGFISQSALKKLKEKGRLIYNNTIYNKVEDHNRLHYTEKALIHVKAEIDDTQMWILDDETLPLIYKVIDNPLGINWVIEK